MPASRSTDSDPFSCALRILGRRDHSAAELRGKLQRFGFSSAAIEAALTRCRDLNYLDDRRFALARSRELLRSGRGVGPKVLLDLKRRGIEAELAREALRVATDEFAPRKILREQLDRRFHGFDYARADEKERRRVVSFFQRRGFDLSIIFAELKK